MSIYPEILAGYHAAKNVLSGMDVTLDHPGTRVPIDYADPMALIGSFPAAYTVQGMALREGINLSRTSRFGMGGEFVMVDYPCPTDAADFEDQLRRVLVPAVQDLQAKAAEDRAARTASEPGPHEAGDAVKRISL